MDNLNWGKPVNGWCLSASLDKMTFKSEEPIYVTVVFENVSEQTQGYGAQGKNFDYELVCLDKAGKEIPLTLFGQRMKENRGEGRYIMTELLPKQNIVNEISLTLHLDLSLPGKYTLTVSREIFPHEGSNESLVIANELSFEIVE